MNPLFYRFSLLLFWASLSLFANGQDYVVLEKPGTTKRIRYAINDEITFRLKDTATIIKGSIQNIGDSVFVVNGQPFQYSHISKVRTRKQYRFQNTVAETLLGGIPSLALVQVVYGVAASQYPLIDRGMRIVMSSGMGLAGILLVSQRYWFHLESGKYRIRKMDTNIY